MAKTAIFLIFEQSEKKTFLNEAKSCYIIKINKSIINLWILKFLKKKIKN